MSGRTFYKVNDIIFVFVGTLTDGKKVPLPIGGGDFLGW